MSIRNKLLLAVLTAYGGVGVYAESRNSLLLKILGQIGGTPTDPLIMNPILSDIVIALGGTVTNPNSRNSILRDIVLASGGTITSPGERNSLIIDWLAVASPVFDRQWFIETSGDEHGYFNGVIGSLTPNAWYNLTDIVDRLFVDGSSSAVVIESDVTGQWNGETNISVEVENYGTIVLTWNGATAYVLVDSAFKDFVIANDGNTLGVNILPRA